MLPRHTESCRVAESEEAGSISLEERHSQDLFARLGMAARDWAALLGISAVVAVLGVLGVSYVVGQGWPLFDGPTTVLLCVASTIIAGVCLLAVDQGLIRVAIRCRADEGGDGEPLLARLTPAWRPRSIALFALVMALFWLPWLIANYPGGTYWDTYYQIFQCYPENHPIAIIPYAECYDKTLTDAYFCDHHPIFDTLIYGAFGMASDVLTGNWMAGVFTFVCLQGAAHVVAFTAAVAYLRVRRCPLVLCFAAYAFFCLMPFVSTWALCMVKDSLFGLFYIPYLIMLFEVVRTRGASLARTRTVVLFALVALLLCLTKKTGLYVVVPTALAAAWVYRAHWQPLVAQALLCVTIMFALLPMLVFPLLNVAPGGKQEVLGPLFQQTAYYVTYYGCDVTDEEREAIDALLEYDNLPSQFTFDFQDEVKYRYNLDASTADIVRYLQTWAAQGLRHPDAYLGALMSLAGFYTAPVAPANIRMVTVDTHMGPDNRYMLWNPDELDWLRNGMADAYDAIAHVPVLDLPLLVVVYALWLPAALLFVMWRRRLRCGVLFVPAIVLLGFCVIAPVFDARYCVPLFNGAPLLVCMVAVLLRADVARRRRPAASGPANALPWSPLANAPAGSPADARRRNDGGGSGDAAGRHHHGVAVGHGRDGALHGAAQGVRRAVRGEGGERSPQARGRARVGVRRARARHEGDRGGCGQGRAPWRRGGRVHASAGDRRAHEDL